MIAKFNSGFMQEIILNKMIKWSPIFIPINLLFENL